MVSHLALAKPVQTHYAKYREHYRLTEARRLANLTAKRTRAYRVKRAEWMRA